MLGAGLKSIHQHAELCSWNKKFCWGLAGKAVPCTLLSGSFVSSGLELQAACSLVIKTTDVVPAGFPLKDKDGLGFPVTWM